MKQSWWKMGLVSVLGTALQAGCRPLSPEQGQLPPANEVVDLDGAIANAAQTKRPIVVLAGEFGQHGANTDVRDLFNDPAIKAKRAEVDLLTLDLSVSRNRATAARYHVVQPPVLVCLSPSGLIVSRDAGTITAELVIKRIGDAVSRSADLDKRLELLQAAVLKADGASPAQLALAEFLLEQKNDREAIPHLTILAGSATTDMNVRVHAWVELARAHLWITEPEKGRHEAKNLIAALGGVARDAVSGGNLVLGMQDAVAKRYALAREEYQTAISASPDSVYANEANKALAELPKENN